MPQYALKDKDFLSDLTKKFRIKKFELHSSKFAGMLGRAAGGGRTQRDRI